MTYLVALNTLSNLAQRNTLTPNGGITFVNIKMASTILNNTTKLSKRLNKDTKQPWKPKLYILRNISNVNSTTKNKLATSEKEKKKKGISYIQNQKMFSTQIFII